jgi:hypothetical protein
VNEALLDLALDRAASVVVVGTAKNTGKTVTFNALRAVAARRGLGYGITSIGRDGEAFDALDGHEKPRVRVPGGTVLALPSELVPRSPALEIIETGEPSALGLIVFARARLATTCEIGGPPSARAIRATIDRVRALATGPVFVDGAIDRIAPLAGGGDAVIVATGAASGATVERVAEVVADVVARLRVPAYDPARDGTIATRVAAALDPAIAEGLLAGESRVVVVADPTKITVRGRLFARLCEHVVLRCERALRVVACTTSSVGRDGALDPVALVRAVARATALPAFDVLARLRA